MSSPIEDYALIGDTQTAALVGRDGSIDWWCVPRFDAASVFARLLGDEGDGRWLVAPAGEVTAVERRYRPGTLVLETVFTTDDGVVAVIDAMPPRDGRAPTILRVVEGRSGSVPMRLELTMRFDYGDSVPWVRRVGGALRAISGPDALALWSPVDHHGVDHSTVAEFVVEAGQRLPFALAWSPSQLPVTDQPDVLALLDDTDRWWQEWTAIGRSSGAELGDPELVERSMITLKALTFAPTGGIVAAPTTSLPERLGGDRNWDYRYCWLRDATFTLYALLQGGYDDEAAAWRDWLLRAVAGEPADLQIVYGPAGERRLVEFELDHLSGYGGSSPVRVGNAAYGQFQLDVYGEVFDLLFQARQCGLAPDDESWHLQRALLEFLEGAWKEPDSGIWEVRGPRRHFVHSKVMAWVAFERAVATVESSDAEGPTEGWRKTAAEIRHAVLSEGYDAERGTFVQSFGSSALDASLLLLPLVGFIEADDPRMVGTVAAIEADLVTPQGFVRRYDPTADGGVDGVGGPEGVFLPCSFWLVDNYTMSGRVDDAQVLFDRLAGLVNDVGLLSEEYDPVAGRMLGNFPQAFSHVSLVNSARNLAAAKTGPAHHRSRALGRRARRQGEGH